VSRPPRGDRTAAYCLLLALWVATFSAACHKDSAVTPPPPECTTRADCTGGIAGGLICASGVCTGCVHSSDCRLTEACDPVQKRCQLLPCFGDQCTASMGCTLGQYCVQGLCLAPGPATTAGCSVVLCGTDRDCNPGQRCNPLTFVCETNVGCDPMLAPCANNEVCDTANGTCVAQCTTATAAEVCGPLVSCIDDRCIQCAQDKDCGPGLVCDTTTGLCAGSLECTSSRECPVPEACDAPTGTCIATARPPCTSNETCVSDERCLTRTGACIAGACARDRFSPNGTMATAARLTAGSTTQLTLCSASQQSWFSLALNSGDAVQVVCDADPLGSFDLQLHAPDGTLLDEEQLAVAATAGSTGTYFVRASTNDASVLYGLQIIIRAGTACTQSPAGSHSSAAASYPLAPGQYGGFTVCPGETTWFVARGSPDAGAPGISADLAVDPSMGGPLLFTLFDSDAQHVLVEDSTGNSNLHVQAASSMNGIFYLRVTGGSATVTNSYDLTVRSLAP
jgi:hypothetical protein